MPTYLIHGFRWPREMVRVYIIMHNLEDASAEWLVREETSSCLLESFRERYPAVLNNLPNLCFKEQYNPNDETLAYHPFAYVADVAHPIDLSMDLDAVQLIVERSTSKSSEASMMQLRDAVLASDSKMAWYIVNCGDERREYDDSDTDTTKNDIDLEQKEDSQTHSVQATPRVMQTIMISKISGTPSSPMTIDSNCRSRNNNLVGRPRTSSSSMTSGSQDARRNFSSPEMSKKSISSPETLSQGSMSPEVEQKGFRKKVMNTITKMKSRSSLRGEHSPRSARSQFDAPPVPPMPKVAY